MQPTPPLAETPALITGKPPTARETQILRTRSGVRLLILAVLLQWIPIVEYLGFTVAAFGVFQVIRGRRAFGVRYERLVVCSVLLFLGAAMSAIALDQEFSYTYDVAVHSDLGSAGAGLALVAYRGLAEGSLIIAVQIAACYVLLAHDLEDRTGRRLLYASLAAQILVAAATLLLVLLPDIQNAVPAAFVTGTPDVTALQAVTAEVSGVSSLRLVDALPALLFAYAYTRAFRRIDRGEIPPPASPPS